MNSLSAREERIIYRALRILEKQFKDPGPAINCPADGRDYLRLRFAGLPREEFHALWLNAQHRLIESDCLFVGTLTQTSVFPRELVRRAIEVNAGAVVLAHNHPGGCTAPSAADIALTAQLKNTLGLIDVTVIDHFIVTEKTVTSLAERGHV